MVNPIPLSGSYSDRLMDVKIIGIFSVDENRILFNPHKPSDEAVVVIEAWHANKGYFYMASDGVNLWHVRYSYHGSKLVDLGRPPYHKLVMAHITYPHFMILCDDVAHVHARIKQGMDER